MARGDLDEALRIRLEDELPVYERLGDVRERAVTLGKIAGIRMARGDLDEALRLYEAEVLPAFQRLGDERQLATARWNLALMLMRRGRVEQDVARSLELIQQALQAARRMGLPLADEIVEALLGAGRSGGAA
jgi:predicted nucleic acid-binding protein